MQNITYYNAARTHNRSKLQGHQWRSMPGAITYRKCNMLRTTALSQAAAVNSCHTHGDPAPPQSICYCAASIILTYKYDTSHPMGWLPFLPILPIHPPNSWQANKVEQLSSPFFPFIHPIVGRQPGLSNASCAHTTRPCPCHPTPLQPQQTHSRPSGSAPRERSSGRETWRSANA
jgi:hypothetical protein